MNRRAKKLSADQIEAIFAEAELDLLVDEEVLFLEAELLAELAEEGVAQEEPQGWVITLDSHRFVLGAYDERADGFPVREA